MNKILIIEDDKFLANAYRLKFIRVLCRRGVGPTREEGIKEVGSFKPDIILLDLVMPKKDGFAVLEELKANPEWKNIPVIISTNLEQQEDIEKALKHRVQDEFLKSNISIKEIVAKVDGFLQKIKS